MPQGAHKYTFTLVSTSLTTADRAAEAEEITYDDPRADIPVLSLADLRRFNLKGVYEGTLGFTLTPDTAGGTLVAGWNLAVENQETMTVTVDQVAIGAETPAPSSDNPQWVFTGIPGMAIGGPVSHGEKRAYPIVLSLITVQYDLGGGPISLGA